MSDPNSVFRVVNPDDGRSFTSFQIDSDGVVEMLSVQDIRARYGEVRFFVSDKDTISSKAWAYALPSAAILWGAILLGANAAGLI